MGIYSHTYVYVNTYIRKPYESYENWYANVRIWLFIVFCFIANNNFGAIDHICHVLEAFYDG